MITSEQRANLLEVILMAKEVGDTTIERISKTRAEDAQTKISETEITNLVNDGYLIRSGNEISFNKSGLTIAEKTLRRHRLAEMLMFSLLGVDRDLASEIACMVEHGIREEMLESVCILMGHPATCPHGRPIPPGPCCKAGNTTVETQVVSLSTLKPGEKGRIVYIKPRNHDRLHRLSALGLNPGVVVELHQRKPAFCLRYEQTELAVDNSVAMDIQVSRIPK